VLTKGVSLSPTAVPSSREVPTILVFPLAILALDDKSAPRGSAAHPDSFYTSTLFCAIGNFANENAAFNSVQPRAVGQRWSRIVQYIV
jgi:hypothetical protein